MAKQKEVEIGSIWTAKVSQRIVNVKVIEWKEARLEGARDRLVCENLATGRHVEMTAGKLRRLVTPAPTLYNRAQALLDSLKANPSQANLFSHPNVMPGMEEH